MSLKITHKNSTAAGTPPAAGDIDVGELAINAADAELYTKDLNGNIRKFPNTTTATADGVKFTQAGAGAVQRTVDSKLKDVVSVKDFGAVGDGTNQTAAIQAAVNAAGASGRTLFFPPGNYLVASSISIASHVSIVGASNGGTAATFINCESAVTMFDVTAGAGASTSFENIYFRHNGASGQIIDFNGSEGGSLRYCTLLGANASGTGPLIYFAASNTVIESNSFNNQRANQFTIEADRTAAFGININSVIRNNLFGGAGSGILVHSSDGSPRIEGIQINDNQFINTGNQPQLKIQSVLSARVHGNMFDQGKTYCIFLDPNSAAYAVEDVVIQNNYISTAQNMTGVSGGVAIGTNAAAVGTISDLAIIGNQIAFSAYGVALGSNTQYFLCSDNLFSAIDQTAITASQSKFGTINGNVIRNAGFSLALADGVDGGPFSISGNYLWASGSISYTPTSTSKFSWNGNIGRKLSGWSSAVTGSITSGTDVYITIPHGLAVTPSTGKIVLTVTNETGGFYNVSAMVDSVDTTNITAQIFFTRIANGTLRVNAYAEA